MNWGALLLAFVALYATIKFYFRSQKKDSLKFLSFSVAGVFFLLTQVCTVIESAISGYNLTIYANGIAEWGGVLSLAFVLSALAIFIRQSKPVFAQFPMIYVALPLLIIVSYLLVKDTYAIKTWLFRIYQGGAILVAFLMYGVYTYRNSYYKVILSGTVLFLLTFLLFWYVPGVAENYGWIWKLTLGAAALTTVYGFDYVDRHETEEVPVN